MAKKMNLKKLKKIRLDRLGLVCLIICAAINIAFGTILNSMESSLNNDIQNLKDQVSTLNTQIDGLNTACKEKSSFDNVREVAKSQGYQLNYATEQTASVVTSE